MFVSWEGAVCPLFPMAIYIFLDHGACKLGEQGGKRPFENISDLNELCVGEEYLAHIIFAFYSNKGLMAGEFLTAMHLRQSQLHQLN